LPFLSASPSIQAETDFLCDLQEYNGRPMLDVEWNQPLIQRYAASCAPTPDISALTKIRTNNL
jgi:hypothetical protein